MSVSVNVSYDKLNRKITVNRSKTVGDLLEASLEKFGLQNQQGLLVDPKTKKALDSGNPIRFSNIVNNGKLELKIVQIERKLVNLKVMKPDGASQVIKIDNHSTVLELIEQLQLPIDDLLMSLMNKVLVVSEHQHKQLKDLFGDVSNLVIRLSIRKDIQQPRGELKPIKKQESKEEEIRKESESDIPEQSEPDTATVDEHNRSTSVNPTKEDSIKPEDSTAQEPSIAQDATASPVEPSSDPQDMDVDPKEMDIDPHETDVDVMYKPSKTEMYENPEEDYELTLNQAKIYQNLVKYKPRKRPTSKPQEPDVYQLRIKFPNNHILAIKLARHEKLGELIKRIDSHLTEDFKSNYILKLSYPPFKSLSLGFMANNKTLTDIPDIHDKTLLIWSSDSKGQYLIDEISKDYNEMPEVKLEKMRDELPEESESVKPVASSGSSNKETNGKKTGDKKVPKWFKVGK